MKKESNPIPKKKWARPKLIILTRGRPEEAVLLSCKGHSGINNGDPALNQNGCHFLPLGFCGSCSADHFNS